ncbi:MAG TPA: LuxR C-terminal-related transcriptional regulator, partial [Acidimicrobiales bacterium]|nr:LuxR C-terminal-related transcriptional regulator [Acidimicrobiales bacterium]
ARGAPLEQLAAHLAASEPSGDEWVARKLEEAGSLALGQGASLEAIGYFNRARAELPAAQSSPEILLGLARAESSLRRRSALKHLRLALDQPVDPRAAALATMQVARAFNDLEARTELGPMLERTAELLSDEETDGKIDVAVAMGLIATSPQAPVLATESLRSAVGSRPDPGTRGEREALALIAVVDSASPRRAPRAELVALIRRAVLGAEFVSEDPLRCELWARVLLALARSSEFEEADRLARAAQAVARLQRLEYAEAEFSTTLAMSLALQGQLVEAEVEVSRALSVMEEQPWPRRVEAVACLASLCLDQGRTEEAERLIAPFEEPDGLPSPLGGAVLLEQRGRVRCLQGRRSEALADLFRAGRRAGECDVDSPVVTSWRSEAALTLAAEGWESDAVRFAEENLELARAHGAHWVVGAALHVLACVGPADRRLARLEEAVELLEGSPAQLRFASATIDLGRVLRESGSSSMRIRSLLRDAADLAFRSRATPLVSSAMTELRLSGARPRRLALSGADSLTSSERRVASLAVDGLSNAEIAVALFLAEKTVEGHLGHAFRKLGIRSRRDLEALGDLGPEESTG